MHNAKARGGAFGRHKAFTAEQVALLRETRRQGALIRTLMRDFHVSKATVYRYLDGVRPDHVNTASHQSHA